MIWATVSSWSCFCWLYNASPSLAAKNMIDYGTDHLVMSVCRIFSCVIGRGCLLRPVHSLGKTLLAYALFHFVLQELLEVALDFLLLHSSPLWWKGHPFWVLVLKGLVDHHRNVQTSASLVLLVGAKTWIAVILNGLPWKWTEIILSSLRLHPSTAFQTLLLTMRGTPFLLRDFWPQ